MPSAEEAMLPKSDDQATATGCRRANTIAGARPIQYWRLGRLRACIAYFHARDEVVVEYALLGSRHPPPDRH
jgi:hypothetical protein